MQKSRVCLRLQTSSEPHLRQAKLATFDDSVRRQLFSQTRLGSSSALESNQVLDSQLFNISRHTTDRSVYALRARGFDGEPFFSSLEEIVTTYHAAIKEKQPNGPYALCGYSFGSIVALEIAKILEKDGDEVKFLATLDQEPHFRDRARGYYWFEVALTLGFFLDLIKEKYAYDILPEMKKRSSEKVIDHVLGLAPEERIRELGLNREKFVKWAELALEMMVIVHDYEPSGTVSKMDVFHIGPLVGLVPANTRQEWLAGYILKWKDFVEDLGTHSVAGDHRTMISPPNLASFWGQFSQVRRDRGI